MYHKPKRHLKAPMGNILRHVHILRWTMSIKLEAIMKWAEIRCLGDLCLYTENEVMTFRNMGKSTMEELKKIMEFAGLRFRMGEQSFKDDQPEPLYGDEEVNENHWD